MTTIVLAHPSERHSRLRVFRVCDGDDDRFVFDVRDFDKQEKAERWAKRMMEFHQADHFERSVGYSLKSSCRLLSYFSKEIGVRVAR
jgi:hypothetical protein